jgi:hypothetical protein
MHSMSDFELILGSGGTAELTAAGHLVNTRDLRSLAGPSSGLNFACGTI